MGGWGEGFAAHHPEKKITAKRNRQQPRKIDDNQHRRIKQRKRIMSMGTWNVQGIRTKQAEVINAIKKMDIDIVALTETKKKGFGTEEIDEYIHLFSGVPKEERAKRGVSLLIKKKYKKLLTNFEAINERIIKVNINILGRRLTIFGIYAPNEDETVLIKDLFFEELQLALENIGDNREIILMGDFNARTGSRRGDKVIGQFGEVNVNNNGDRLADFCTQNTLKIENGFFKHKDIHKYTWIQHTRQRKSIIDYIITSQDKSTRVIDVRAYRGPECGSDHYLVKGLLYFPYKSFNIQTLKMGREPKEELTKLNKKKYIIANFKEESIRYLYQQRLDQKLTDNTFNDVEEMYEHIKQAIHEASYEALGTLEKKKPASRKIWWNDEIEEEINNKKQAYLKWLNTKAEADRLVYTRKRNNVRKLVKEEKIKTWDNKCREIEMCIGGRRCTEAWRFVNNIRADKKQIPLEQISAKKWEEYYGKLLSEDRPQFIEEQTNITVDGEPIEITIDMVQKAIKNMKNGKASGPGDVAAEMLKNGTIKLNEMITKLLNKCINENKVPKEWKMGFMSSIFKKGDPRKCENYRGITVTSTFSRLYGRVLRDLVETEYELIEAEEQNGFRAGRSCMDNIFCLKQLMEKKISTGRELHLLFIDLAKAYDNVPIQRLWKALENTNISTRVIKAIKELYRDTKIKMKMGESISNGISTSKGLKQGCCLSPTLFKIYIEHSLRTWKRKCKGMGINIGDNNIYTLQFADDQVLIAQDKDDLQYMTRKIKEEYEKAGLSMNLDKTKYLCIGGESDDLELENGEIISACNSYQYLGVRIQKDGKDEEEIRQRIGQGRRGIKRLNGIWWSKEITKKRKYNIYNTVIKSIVLYGAEGWRWTEDDKRRLEALEMDALRRSCRISRLDRVRNTKIKELIGLKENIVQEAGKRQLIWYGHVKRMADHRLPKITLDWVPPERRKRGRPRKSWNDGIQKSMSERNLQDDQWQDRLGWRKSLEIGQRRQTF